MDTLALFWLDEGLQRMAVRDLAKPNLGFKSNSAKVYVRERNKRIAVESMELWLGSWTLKLGEIPSMR